MSNETNYDAKATLAAAEKLAVKIKGQFHVNVDTKQNSDGSVMIVANNSHLADRDEGSSSITAKNFNASIDSDYRSYRSNGWRFDQPRGASFTIGIPSKVSEMTIDLPMSTVVPPLASPVAQSFAQPVDYVMNNGYDTAAAGVMSPSSYGDDDAIAIGDVAEADPAMDASKITVYAGSISSVSYSETDPIACFDVIFTVGMNCGGRSETYQVVKRIGIDKVKIAAQASAGSPVSVVESKETPEAKVKRLEKEWKDNKGFDDFPTARHEATAILKKAREALAASKSHVKESQQTKSVISDVQKFRRLAGLD